MAQYELKNLQSVNLLQPPTEPSDLRNYAVVDVTSTTMTVYFDDPEEHAECIQGYQVEYINLNDTAVRSHNPHQKHRSNTQIFNDLKACSTYSVSYLHVYFY